MCNVCPRSLGVRRYWYLPHWSGPNVAKTLARHQANSTGAVFIVPEYECPSCDFVHVGHALIKFRIPERIEGGHATHYSTCPNTNEIVYLKGV